jgi:hypothetical protein
MKEWMGTIKEIIENSVKPAAETFLKTYGEAMAPQKYEAEQQRMAAMQQQQRARMAAMNRRPMGGVLPRQQQDNNSSIVTPTGFLTYTNATYGITIQHPSGWSLITTDLYYDDITNIIGFYAPYEYRLDEYKERLRISQEDMLLDKTRLGTQSNLSAITMQLVLILAL